MKRRVLQITSCILITIIVCSYVLASNYYGSKIIAAAHQHTTDCYADSDLEKDLICDQIVINLVPEHEQQQLKIGEEVNRKGTAYFLDGQSEVVECEISSFNEYLYSMDQEVTFLYGTYSKDNASHIPFTTTVIVNIDAYMQLSVTSNNSESGIVSGSSGKMLENTSCSVTAHCNPGVLFSGWYIDGELISNYETYTFNMPARDIEIIAHFTKIDKLKVELNQLFHDTYDQEPYFNGTSYLIESGIVVTKDMLTVSKLFDDGTNELVEALDYNLSNNIVNRYGTNLFEVSTIVNNHVVTGSAVIVGDSIEFSEFIDELLEAYGLDEADYDSLIVILNDSVKQLHEYQKVIEDIANEINLSGLSDDLTTRLSQVYTEVAKIYDRVKTLEIVLQETLGDQVDITDADAISKKILEIRKEIDEANAEIAKLQIQIQLLDLSIEEKTILLLSIMNELSNQIFINEDLKVKKTVLTEELLSQEKLVKEVDLEILNLKQAISSQETTISQLEQQQGISESKIAGTTSEITTIQQELDRLKNENKYLNEQIVEIEKRTKELNSDVATLQKTVYEVSGTVTAKEEEISNVIAETNTLQTVINIETLEKLLIELDKANTQLSTTNANLINREELQ